MKSTDELKDLRALDRDGLSERLASTEHELMNIRFKQAAGQLEHTAQLRQLRKRVARIRTLLNAQKLS